MKIDVQVHIQSSNIIMNKNINIYLVADNVCVIKHLIFNANSRFRDLVSRSVHEAAHSHDILDIKVCLNRASNVSIVITVDNTTLLAHLLLVVILKECLQISSVEVGKAAVLNYCLTSEHAAVRSTGRSLTHVFLRKKI